MWKDGLSLTEYIESLLKDGKDSRHDDFKALIKVFGLEKIQRMVLEARERFKKEDEDERRQET